MSDVSKYANLPGIAFDQPDVYESSDLPESDQIPKRLADVDQTENVTILDVKPEDAFKVFQDQLVDGQAVDFREPLLGKKRIGYQSHGEWEILGAGARAEESVSQKYHRLQAESSELMETLKDMKESSAHGFASGLEQSSMIENLDALSSGLKQLHVEEMYCESDILKGVQDSMAMLEKIEESAKNDLKSKTKLTEGGKSGKHASTSNAVTYQLLCRPDHSKAQDLSKLNVIEQRIKRIEALVGTDQQKTSLLTSLTDDKTLMEAVSTMSTRVSQLDPNVLEGIDARLTSLLHKLNQLSEKKGVLEDVQQQKKINELYEIVMNSSKDSAALPEIASRMNSLQDIQEQAIQFSSALSYIDTMQTQVVESMADNQEELKAIKETFSINIESISKMMREMDDRINRMK